MMIRRLSFAATILMLGLREIFSRPKLFVLAIIPLIIDIVIFISTLRYGSRFLNSALQSTMAWIFPGEAGWWFDIAYYPLLILFWVVFLIAVTSIVYLLASVVASPFNALIAENILVARGLVTPVRMGLFAFMAFSVRMIGISLARAGILISLSLVALLLSFLPGVNFVSSYFAAMVVGFDAADYTMEAKGFSLADRFATVRRFFPEYAGMGFMLIFVLMIPGLALLMMPVIVSGATVVMGQALKEIE